MRTRIGFLEEFFSPKSQGFIFLCFAVLVLTAPAEPFTQSCNGTNCGDDSCYLPPASSVGTSGVSFDYQAITGTGHSHCCNSRVGSTDSNCDDPGADLFCQFGSCIPIGSPCSTANFCSMIPPPIPMKATPNPICAPGQAYTQVPILTSVGSPNYVKNAQGFAEIHATFNYVFDSMYDGVTVANNCGGGPGTGK